METVMAEFAGRDSVAAIIKYAKENPETEFVLTYAETGLEYGVTDKEKNKKIKDSILFVKEKLREYGCNTSGSIFRINQEEIFRIVAIKHSQSLIDFNGFYHPCIICHLLLHIARIPIMNQYNITKLLTGERSTHDGKEKLSQLPESLARYKSIIKDLGYELIQPILNIKDTGEIIDITEGQDLYSPNCILSKSYKSIKEINYVDYSKRIIDLYSNISLDILKAYETNRTNLVEKRLIEEIGERYEEEL